MKQLLTISLLFISIFGFSQKTTLTIDKDSIIEYGDLNGFYASNIYETEFENKGDLIKVKERLFLKFSHNYIQIVQVNLTPERALELYQKERLFNPKLTLTFGEIVGDSIKKIQYQNLDSTFAGEFIEFDLKEQTTYNATINSITNNNRKPTIEMPVYIEKLIPKLTKRNMILIGKSDYFHTVERLLFTKLD